MTIYQMVLIKMLIPSAVPICSIFHFGLLKANNLKKYKKYRYYNILRQLNLFERMQKQVQLTKNYFTTIYNRKSAQSVTNPTLQILAFQLGPEESQSELIIRLSDGTTFLDCSLIGPFTFHNNKILHCHATKGMIQYRVHNLVKLNSIVIKDTINKICKIKLVVKDMDLLEDFKCIYGRPEELVQYLDNINITSYQDQGTNINKYALSLKNISFEEPNLRNSIKIQQQQKNQSKQKHKPSLKNTPNFTNIFQNPNSKNDPSFKDRLFQGQQILTGKEIIDGKAGIFIGRLLRMKMTSKQTKEGQLSVLILGFLDKTGEMVRINMAGRIAIKEFKQLKKQRCYFIKGLQIFQTDKMPHPLIKIKEKQFRINQVLSQNTPIVEMFQNSYFHWDHEINSIESERVDVIGIIEQIDDKIQHDYVQSQSQGQDKIDKHVVRIVVKNIAKTVRVSFWAEQISTYKNAQLRKRQAIILQDIRKKKNKFLDFTHQSSIIRLQNEKQLKQKFLHLLPDPLQQKPPSNINQITNFLNSEQEGTKNINLNLYLTQIDTNKMIYKSCIQCKRKVQKHNFCSFCPASIVKEQDQSSSFQYKYNCQLEFSDWSGSIYTVMFDAPALMLLGKNAKQISQLTAQQLQNLREDLLYRQYNVNVQNKNLRFILRNIQSIQQQNYPKISEKNVVMIQELKKNKKKQ